MNKTKRQFFDAAVKELNLDTRDPFTLLFANACALLDQRDALRAENVRLREALRKCIAGMPHNPPQDEAVALLHELGEDV